MLMNSISLVPRSALCSPLNAAQWAQSKHENTLKAEVTGELVSKGHHSWPHSQISDEWFFYPNWPSIHVFTNVVKWLKCLRICLFTSLPGHSGWPGEEIRKAMCTKVTRLQGFDWWEIKQPAWNGRWRGDPESCMGDIKLLFPEGSIYRPINQSGAVAVPLRRSHWVV